MNVEVEKQMSRLNNRNTEIEKRRSYVKRLINLILIGICAIDVTRAAGPSLPKLSHKTKWQSFGAIFKISSGYRKSRI